MTTETKTEKKGFDIPCLMCEWSAHVATVRQGREEYTAHMASEHKGAGTTRQIWAEVSAAYNGTLPEGETPATEAQLPDDLGDGVRVSWPIKRINGNPFEDIKGPRMRRGIDELAKSIKLNGQVQDCLARSIGGGFVELAAGHRRWLAAEKAGLKTLNVTVRNLTDVEMMTAMFEENANREDLSPMELALAVEHALDVAEDRKIEITNLELAASLQRDPGTISNAKRTLRSVPRMTLDHVEKGDIGWSSLREVWPFTTTGKGGHRHHDEIVRIIDYIMPDIISPDRRGELINAEQLQAGVEYRLGGMIRNEQGKPKVVRWRPLNAAAARTMTKSNSGFTRSHVDPAAYEEIAPGMVHDFGKLGLFACNDKAWDRVANAAQKADPDGKATGAPGKTTVAKLDDAKTPSQKLAFVQGKVSKLSVKQARRQLAVPKALGDDQLTEAVKRGVTTLKNTTQVYDHMVKGKRRRVIDALLPNTNLWKADDSDMFLFPLNALVDALEPKPGEFDGFGAQVFVMGDQGNYYSGDTQWKPTLFATDTDAVFAALETRFEKVTADAKQRQKAESDAIKAAVRTLAVQGPEHGNTTRFMLASAALHFSLPAVGEYRLDRIGAATTLEWIEKRFSKKVIERDDQGGPGAVKQSALFAEIAALTPDRAFELLGELMLDAIVDPRPPEFFTGTAATYLQLLNPPAEAKTEKKPAAKKA